MPWTADALPTITPVPVDGGCLMGLQPAVWLPKLAAPLLRSISLKTLFADGSWQFFALQFVLCVAIHYISGCSTSAGWCHIMVAACGVDALPRRPAGLDVVTTVADRVRVLDCATMKLSRG